MVDGLYVIHKTSGIPIYSKEFNSSSKEINNDLIPSIISAIIKFGEHLKIGQITNFDTMEHKAIVSSTGKNLLALVYNPLEYRIEDPHTMAGYLLEEFENKFPEFLEDTITTDVNTQEFNEIVKRTIELNVLPFFYNVVRWANKEYGGSVFIRQEQYTSDENPVIIDIVLDRGEKLRKGVIDKITDRVVGDDFKKDVVYVKVIDGQAGFGEVEAFFKLCSAFGRRRGKSNLPSHFPSVAVVVAKNYSPTIPRLIESLPKKDNRCVLLPEAAPRIAKMINQPPKSHQCYIQCWQWDKQYPDLIYE